MMARDGARVAILCLLAWGAAGTAPALAQDVGGLELGPQVAALRLSEFETTDVGVGVQAGWPLHPIFTVDGAVSWFPGDGGDESPLIENQHRVLGLLGIRAGLRRGRTEVFARARPGFLRFAGRDHVPCIAIFPVPLECQVLSGQTSFVTEIGGGVHVGPGEGSPLYLSVDVTDLLVRYGSLALRPGGEVTEDGFLSHNLLFAAGVGWRF